MALQDQFPFLPGHLVEFKDGGLSVRTDPNPPTTESILILGTAVDGPKNVPVAVDPSTAEKIFGKAAHPNGTPNGATLLVGFEEAWNAGCRDIRLMRISGEKATGEIVCEAQTISEVKVHEENLALAAGNTETDIVLANLNVDPASVRVYAKGVELPDTAFTVEVDPGSGTSTVKIAANVADAKADVTVVYEYTAGSTTHQVTENGVIDPGTGAFTPYVLNGNDEVFTLAFAPKTFTLLANGKAVDPSGYTVNGNTLTVKAGAVEKGALLTASYSYVDTTVYEPKAVLEGYFEGSVYNGVKRKVENILGSNGTIIGKKLVIIKPPAKKLSLSEKPLEYSSLDYPTLGSLAEAVNSDPNNNVVRMVVPKEFENVETATLQVSVETPLSGGNDGIKLTKEELFEALSGKRDANGYLIKPGAYQLLENYTVDYIVPMGVFLDDRLPGGKSFAYELALTAAVMSHRNHVTHGVIATSSPSLPTLEEIERHVNELIENYPLDFYMKDREGNDIVDADGNRIALGQFLSVVAGPDVQLTNSRFGRYTANSAAVYAAMLSTLPVRSSPMNKPVPGIQGLRFTFGNAQLDKLTAARFVTYQAKNNGTEIVVTDGVTAAAPDSDYAQITAFRAVKAAADEVRAACEPFRGEPNDVANRNAMSSAIDKRLNAMKEQGAIQGYEFRVISSLVDQVLGRAQIELTIVPPLTLRKITTVISLAPTL